MVSPVGRRRQADLHIVGEFSEDALLVPVLPAFVLVAIKGHNAMAHLVWYFMLIKRILQDSARVTTEGISNVVRRGGGQSRPKNILLAAISKIRQQPVIRYASVVQRPVRFQDLYYIDHCPDSKHDVHA